ncbi:hypothetical protein VCRA2112O187_7600001 [Vibrio crassostreae]|nr:hypothetical protein VCRA2112O187_7600001 [Vibrio crassostreae]CAK2521927.1 hypothetical protein VCRA2119O52_5760002 [Vibrio crassostreae]CAK3995501.1 hypothetical protein VCRA2130O400_5750001 [Vibrio crassostreae]
MLMLPSSQLMQLLLKQEVLVYLSFVSFLVNQVTPDTRARLSVSYVLRFL